MQWSEAVKERVTELKPIEINMAVLHRIMEMIDLTSLNDNDTEASVALFCQKARTPICHVAAVCVYPKFVRLIAAEFAGTAIKAATVANFPEGNLSLEAVLVEIGRALEDGAEEIDVVLPYQRYLAGEQQYIQSFVTACKAACGEKAKLKVILETGVLNEASIIADAAYDVLTAGADFIKTSTGKVATGATLEAAATMLLVIKHLTPQLNRPLGLKISGGIRDVQQAAQYLELADNIMGRQWPSPDTFRLGASQLVDAMLKEIGA